MTISSIGKRWKLASLPTKEEAIGYAIDHWIAAARSAIAKRGQFVVALSGGSTPEAIYHELASQYRDQVDWEHVLLFWSDERSVPPDHPKSNYRMSMHAGLNQLPIPEENIFRMQAESDIEVHAAAYEHLIRTKTNGIFDLMMLGMGDDGHTASLFPETEALEEKKALVTPNHVSKLDTWRMTLTFSCINASRQIALYVLGEKKRARLTEVLAGEEHTPKFPVQHVGDPSHPALWITDLQL